MHRLAAHLSAASVALAACAGRGAPAPATPASTANAQATGKCAQSTQGAQPASPWREMTWAEYYADVTERASRHNVEVIWVTPPDVHEPRKVESPVAHVAAACAR